MQVGEAVAAIGTGSSLGFSGVWSAVVVSVNENRDARDANFSGILSAVTVGVVEFSASYGARQEAIPKINCRATKQYPLY